MSASIAQAPRLANFSQDPIYLVVETDQMDGSTPPYTPTASNLKSYVELYKRTSTTPEYITKLAAPYSTQTKQARYNLSDILNDELTAPLPYIPSIQDAAIIVRQTDANMLTAYASIGDQQGIPATSNIDTTTSDIHIIRGSTRYWQGFGSDSLLQPWYLLHSYRAYIDNKLQLVAKNITKTQTELIYFYCRETTALNVTISAIGENGNYTAVRPISITPGINYIYAGYKQLDIDTLASGDNILSYTLTIGATSLKGNRMAYNIDQTVSDYEMTFLYENGCGGMESVRMSGRHNTGLSVSKSMTQSTVWAGVDFINGTRSSGIATGIRKMTINTGNYSKAYINHLQQTLYSDLWLEDPRTRKLYKWTIETSDITPLDDLSDLYNIELSIKLSIDEHSSNTFNV